MTGEPGVGDPPTISVISGNPTPEEIAALVVVLSTAGSPGLPESARMRSQWAAYWRSLRTSVAPGPGAWRQSVRP